MKNKFSIAMSLAVIMAMLLTSIGFADDLADNIDALVDAAPESVTIASGGSTKVGFYLVATTGANDVAGCNVDSSYPATVTFNVAGVTANPSSIEFTTCGTDGKVDVTFSATTSTTVTYLVKPDAPTGGKPGSKWAIETAKFNLTVTAPTNTAPSVSVIGVTNGATYEAGSVPAAACSVTDAEDVNPSATVALSAITGPSAAYGLGSQTASCSYTDAGGLTDSDSVTYTIVDNTNPIITFVGPSITEWYNADVTANWTCSDAGSGVISATASATTSGEGTAQDATGTCTDNAGNSVSDTQSFQVDKTLPTISGSASPAANGYGWNKTDVTVSFNCADSLSGVASCASAQTLSGEGAGQSATGSATDNAGNTASATVSNINIDKTAPAVSATASPVPNVNGWNNTNVTVSFSGTDGLSGIASCDPNTVLSGDGAGQFATGSCADKAGNSASATASNINIDQTAPSVSLVGGPADGTSYYFGSVPAAPTCNASDALSGLDGTCSVSGYSALVGPHIVTAAATDQAGNSASASVSYTVLAWTVNGFYAPVDKGIHNTIKGGATVPLKFEVFAGPTELTSTSIITTFVTPIACVSAPTDDIEQIVTGATSLRYDTTGGQFIWNWQTPKGAVMCYRVTAKTADGSSIFADFKTK